MAPIANFATLLAIASFTLAQQVSHEPCNKIRQQIQLGNELPAITSYSCLTSVPFDKATGKSVVENFKKWTALHSTVGDLKNPGVGYPNDPVDLMALIDEMITKIDGDTYTNQYQFEEDMAYLSFKSYDGHYSFRGPTFSMFQWIRGERPSWYEKNGVYEGALISVSASEKGDVLPEVYFHSDLNEVTNASPITKIDGKPIIEYLEKEMTHQTFHDPDARWNTLFAREQADSPGAWIVPYTYPGSNFTATFKNGTSKTVQTVAQVYDDALTRRWMNVVDGKTFYDEFVKAKSNSGVQPGTSKPIIGEKRSVNVGEAPVVQAAAIPRSSDSNTLMRSTKRDAPAQIFQKRAMPPNYPTPVVTHTNQQIGAFFLDAPGLEDVAVLSFNTFSSEDSSEVQEFQWLVERFITYAKENKKTKMIIDVSSNGGGTLFLAYDVFKQFFPSLEPDIGVRHPATEAVNTIGEQFGTINLKSQNKVYAAGLTAQEVYMSPLHWASNVDADLNAYSSWDEMAGPVTLNGANYTEIMRYNLSYEHLGHGGLKDISGYGTRADLGKQPFEARDIVLVHDGYCASTCSIFTDLMRRQGGVRSIALGGRPGFGPMQSVGGTKGAILFSWDVVYPWIESITQFFGTESQRKVWRGILPGKWPIEMGPLHAPMANGRNAYQPGSATPLQFLNETAECRLFYTPAMLSNITAVWDAVARVAWDVKGGAGQQCVPGSVTDGKPIGNVNLTDANVDLPKSGKEKTGSKGNDDGEAPKGEGESAAISGRYVDLVSLAVGVLVAGAFSL